MVVVLKIAIPADTDLHDQLSLRNYFQNLLDDDECQFSAALDLAGDQKTTHAIVENVTISNIGVVGELIHIDYHVELSEFQACQDLMNRYRYTRTIVGTRSGHHWYFDEFVPLPERSTCDEL